MNELCEVMHKVGLPPMAVLHLAAWSIGTVYARWPTPIPASIAPVRLAAASIDGRRGPRHGADERL